MARVRSPRVDSAAQVQGLFLFFGLAIAAFFPFLTLYLEEYHGLTAAQIGIVIAFSAAARLVANPVWGHQADTRLGRVRVLRICLVGAAVAALALNAVTALAAVIVVTAVHSVFLVGQGPNLDALALSYLGPDRMSDYGRIRGWESVSYAAGGLAFGFALQRWGAGWAMPIYAVAALLLFAWTITVPRDHPTALEGEGRLGAVGAVFREAPRIWGFLAAALLVWTGFNAAWNFIALRITSEGGGALLIGLGVALGGLVELPTMRGSSRLQRRFGLRRVYMLGCVVYGIGFLLWGTVSNPTVLSALTMLEGIGFSLLFTTGVVIIGRLVPSHLLSTGNAILFAVGFGLGPIIGAGLGGVVYEHLGAATLYGMAFVVALLAAVVAWFALDIPALEHQPTAAPEEVPPVPLPDTGPTV